GLDVETAYQADFSLDWHSADAYVTPSAFYHYVENYIMGQASGSGMSADLKWDNTDAQFFGAELEAGYRFSDNLRTDASVNYVRGMRVNALNGDDDLYRIAPLNGRLQLTYEESSWSTSMEGVFVADQGDVAGYNEEHSTKGYMQLNLRAQYEPCKGLVIATGMENVLDEQRYNHLGGYQDHIVTNEEDGTPGVRNFLPGRNMYATMGYSW
ncbi:MAG: TonB-dependent receptor, partial [Methylococcales bacterium]|nr:TonB-dependent receptor [Methylococcales bacterium]